MFCDELIYLGVGVAARSNQRYNIFNSSFEGMSFHEADRLFNSTRIKAKEERKNKIKQNYRFLSSMCCYCCRLKRHSDRIRTHSLTTRNWIDNCCWSTRSHLKMCMRSSTIDHNQTYVDKYASNVGSQKATETPKNNNNNTKIYAIIWPVLVCCFVPSNTPAKASTATWR